jgi:hypothetical protein
VERLTLGTKEFLVVRVRDRLGRLTTLEGTDPTFDVRERGQTEYLLQGIGATASGMNALCLVDTEAWTPATYDLYMQFNSSPEIPRLGPFSFDVA